MQKKHKFGFHIMWIIHFVNLSIWHFKGRKKSMTGSVMHKSRNSCFYDFTEKALVNFYIKFLSRTNFDLNIRYQSETSMKPGLLGNQFKQLNSSDKAGWGNVFQVGQYQLYVLLWKHIWLYTHPCSATNKYFIQFEMPHIFLYFNTLHKIKHDWIVFKYFTKQA